jgi:hypothetical protein
MLLLLLHVGGTVRSVGQLHLPRQAAGAHEVKEYTVSCHNFLKVSAGTAPCVMPMTGDASRDGWPSILTSQLLKSLLKSPHHIEDS